jgi:tetratricopeptide (TPR) repeat protein
LQEYQTAAKYEPTSSEIHYNLGNVYLKMGDNEQATNQFQLAFQLNPDHADARRMLDHLHNIVNAEKKN